MVRSAFTGTPLPPTVAASGPPNPLWDAAAARRAWDRRALYRPVPPAEDRRPGPVGTRTAGEGRPAPLGAGPTAGASPAISPVPEWPRPASSPPAPNSAAGDTPHIRRIRALSARGILRGTLRTAALPALMAATSPDARPGELNRPRALGRRGAPPPAQRLYPTLRSAPEAARV